MSPEDVTLVKGAIHNPDEPRHFMTVTPAARLVQATIEGQVIASSSDAVIVREVGRGIYDPVVYFPRNDVDMGRLETTATTTYCPLKGNTEYFDITVDGKTHSDAAWSYIEMRLGDELRGLVAFDSATVDID